MVNVIGNDIWRGGKKIGYINGNDIWSHDNKKLGYVSGNHVYSAANNRKLLYLEGDFIKDPNGNEKMRIEDNHEHVIGGEISDVHRAAVRELLGD